MSTKQNDAYYEMVKEAIEEENEYHDKLEAEVVEEMGEYVEPDDFSGATSLSDTSMER